MNKGTGRHSDRRRSGIESVVTRALYFAVAAAVVLVGVGVARESLARADTGTDTSADIALPVEHDRSTRPSPVPTATVSPQAVRKARPVVQRVVEVDKPIKKLSPAALRARAESQALAQAATKPVAFKIGTFNVLGSQHSAAGGDRHGFASAAVRSPQAAALIRQHGVSVVGMQELQDDQLATIQRLTGFAAYPGTQFGVAETDNSILYDPARFAFVEGTSFPVVFMGRSRPQTVLKLRELTTGREMWFVNMHVSAGLDRRNTATRVAGQLTGVSKLNELQATGLPVFLTGDMNDRAPFFCRVLPPTGMVAAVGGSTSGGCRPPARMPVDWVVASNDTTFSGYWLDESPVKRRISDHFFVSAQANVAPSNPQ